MTANLSPDRLVQANLDSYRLMHPDVEATDDEIIDRLIPSVRAKIEDPGGLPDGVNAVYGLDELLGALLARRSPDLRAVRDDTTEGPVTR